MDNTPDRLHTLAAKLDLFTEDDLLALADITPSTAEAWRKRHRGPAHIIVGNRVFYPREAVAAFLKSQIRDRAPVAKAML